MFKILLIVLIVGGIFAYFKYSKSENKLSLPQFPQNLTKVDLNALKTWSSDTVNKYFPESASQTAVLGEKAKNESLLIIVEAAKKLSPEEFKTLQQFVCEPAK